LDASLDKGALRIVAGSYGAHEATGSHTVNTTARSGANISPALAIAAEASSEPSKQRRAGCVFVDRAGMSVS
jgi:hypothetical protein